MSSPNPTPIACAALSREDVVAWLTAHGFPQEAEAVRADTLTVPRLAALWFPGQAITPQAVGAGPLSALLRLPHLTLTVWTTCPDLSWVRFTVQPLLTTLRFEAGFTRPRALTSAEVIALLEQRLQRYLDTSARSPRTQSRREAVRFALEDVVALRVALTTAAPKARP